MGPPQRISSLTSAICREQAASTRLKIEMIENRVLLSFFWPRTCMPEDCRRGESISFAATEGAFSLGALDIKFYFILNRTPPK